jgi:hypothetical protein
MMIEGSGSGSIPLTSESGSGRPKNMWIRWIRNTAQKLIKDDSTARYLHPAHSKKRAVDTSVVDP